MEGERLAIAKNMLECVLLAAGNPVVPQCQFPELVGASAPLAEDASAEEKHFWGCGSHTMGPLGWLKPLVVGARTYGLCGAHYRVVLYYLGERAARLTAERVAAATDAHKLIGPPRAQGGIKRGKCTTCGRVDVELFGRQWVCPNFKPAVQAASEHTHE